MTAAVKCCTVSLYLWSGSIGLCLAYRLAWLWAWWKSGRSHMGTLGNVPLEMETNVMEDCGNGKQEAQLLQRGLHDALY